MAVRRWLRNIVTAAVLLLGGIAIGVLFSTRFESSTAGAAGSSPASPASTAPAPSAASLPAGAAPTFAPVAKAVMPAVVNVSTTRILRGPQGGGQAGPMLNDPFLRRFFGDEFFRRFQAPRERRQSALGSGVIVSSDGYIVTNNHVVEKADQIRILLPDKREFVGKVVGTDPPSDIAVVKIDAKNLPTVPWGNSDNLQVGDFVLAVGNPFGLTSTVTMGIVSATGRANVGIADYEDFIQTDAAVNPGNSGGALIDTRGELVGINTAIFSQSGGYIGIGFAVPSAMAHAAMDSLIRYGKVTRGWLGVSVQDINADLAKQFGLAQAEGAVVTEVQPNSPAAKAGIKAGDIILGENGKPIDSGGTLRNLVAQTPIGETVNLDVMRNQKHQNVSVKIAELPKQMMQRNPRPSPDEDEAPDDAG